MTTLLVGADLEGYASLLDEVHERGILDGRGAVADALGAELDDGVSDRFGADLFACVGDGMKPRLAGRGKDILVGDAGVADLLAAQPDADDAVAGTLGEIAKEVAQVPRGIVGTEAPRHVDDEPDVGAALGGQVGKALDERIHDAV